MAKQVHPKVITDCMLNNMQQCPHMKAMNSSNMDINMSKQSNKITKKEKGK